MTSPPFPAHLLARLRNQIPIAAVVGSCQRGFVCPLCAGRDTNINLSRNLARCFSCQKNFNPIDWLMASQKISFPQAVGQLEKQLDQRPAKPAVKNSCTPSDQKKRISQPTHISKIMAPLLENIACRSMATNHCQHCKKLAARLAMAEQKLARIEAILTARPSEI